MSFKLINLNTTSYLNSEIVNTGSPTEILQYIVNNILVLEQTIFTGVVQIVQKLDSVLITKEGLWLKNFFNQKVYVNGSFYYKNAILFSIICEILMLQKYVYLEKGDNPLEIPELPDYTDTEIESIPRYYKADWNGRINQFIESIQYNN